MSKDVRHYDVIVSPVITEKATNASEENKVIFKVRRDATKPEIKAAVEGLFDVRVEAVNTLLRKGKRKVFRGRRPSIGLQEGSGDPRRGQPHRRHDGSLSG